MARTQDFTPFTPELLGAMSGPDPCRKAAFSRRERVTSDPLLDLRTHHFGLATPLIKPYCVRVVAALAIKRNEALCFTARPLGERGK